MILSVLRLSRRSVLVTAVLASLIGGGRAIAAEDQAASAPGRKPETRKRVLIVTGEDYKGHLWQQTTPVLEQQLRKDSRLAVQVTENLMFLRSPKLRDYDVVVMHFKNYDPKVPGPEGYRNLANFVDQGGGLVLVHFACGAFQELKDDFVKLAGRAWNPELRGHDPHGKFRVEIVDTDHPITRRFPAFETTDELYTCLDGDTPITVLAEAQSKVDQKRYPMAFVLQCGQGRVFHSPLGHDVAALSVPAVGELFRRGCAWASGLEPVAEPVDSAKPDNASPWTFVSIPDFLNVDTEYPQEGWEDAITYVLEAVKAENPDFVLIAGDLVMGRWWSEADIDKYAAIYYPAWTKRMQEHGLKFYTAIGDHELGDNPWPPPKAKLVPRFKEKFREYLGMPPNGPEQMKGTAFWWKHKNTLFVAVDPFEPGKGPQGGIVCQVTGEQIAWLEGVLTEHGDVDHVAVMGHTPILTPVWKWSSSGLVLSGGLDSPLWQTMKQHRVDLYLCGEVHAITCIERDGIEQIAHGGLFGYNPEVSYLVATVSPDRIELELKAVGIVNSGEKLWQVGSNRPQERVAIAPEAKERGFRGFGTMVIDKTGGTKTFREKTGLFDESHNPQTERPVVEIKRLKPAVSSQRELKSRR